MTLADLSIGMLVSWIRNPRGGHGFALPVDATVVKMCGKRVRIEIALRDGHRVERVVQPDALRSRYP